MNRDPQRVIAALADGTRYGIYQHVLSLAAPVGVPEISQRFGVHPNVARMHLGKLVQAGLLASHSERTGKGGRPSFHYTAHGAPVSMAMPLGDRGQLAELLVESLSLLGEAGKEAVAACGKGLGRKLLAKSKQQGEQPRELPNAVASALRLMGIDAQAQPGGKVVLHNCGFREVAENHPDLVCLLCHAIVEGVAEKGNGDRPDVALMSSVPEGASECTYQLDDNENHS